VINLDSFSLDQNIKPTKEMCVRQIVVALLGLSSMSTHSF